MLHEQDSCLVRFDGRAGWERIGNGLGAMCERLGANCFGPRYGVGLRGVGLNDGLE